MSQLVIHMSFSAAVQA